MITYYTEQEFEKVVIDTIVSAIIEQKADIEKELSCVYFVEKPDIEYAIKGKAVLRTSFNNNGYFIKESKK